MLKWHAYRERMEALPHNPRESGKSIWSHPHRLLGITLAAREGPEIFIRIAEVKHLKLANRT
jgi:hypothetical protein